MPSNQIPGAFRPIIPNDQPEQHLTKHQNVINLNALHGQYHTEVQLQQQQQRPHQQPQHIDIIPSTPKPFYIPAKYEQSHSHQPQQKYVAYVRPQQQYIKVVNSTPKPSAIAPEDEQQPQYVYVEHIPAQIPVATTTRKPNIKVYKNSYKIQSDPALPQIKPDSGRLAGNDQLDSLFANIK